MGKPKFQLLFLLVLLLTSCIFRFYKLGEIPSGLAADEADVGYNAYSVLKTGKDVYNRKFPLFFQSIDSYQPPIQIYVSIPAIYFLGLNEFAIRILPAILGALTPILFFFSAKFLLPKQIKLAYIAAVLSVFAPWNIAISRALFVTIEVIFLYLLFLTLFLASIVKNHKLLPLSFLVLGLTVYAYNIAMIYLPMILVIVVITYKKELIKRIRWTLFSILLILLMILPALFFYLNPDTRNRFNTNSIFIADVTLPVSISEIVYDQQNNLPFANLIHNRRAVYVNSMLESYFDYFNLDNLFVNSKNIRYFYVNNVGLFYLIELPFVLWGLYILFKRRKQAHLLILALFFISPIPATMSLGSPFFHRAPLLLLTVQLISAAGISGAIESIRSMKIKYITHIFIVITIIYITSVYFFLHQYFVHSPQEFRTEFDNGAWYSTMKDAIGIINAKYDEYDKIVFTWSRQRLMPQVYYLFYNQIDPRILQEKAAKWTSERPSYSQIYTPINKIDFRPINWEEDKKLKNVLFVGYPEEFPEDVQNIVEKTYLPNGEQHFLIVGSNK